MFQGDLQSQGRMLTHMLHLLVYVISRPENMELGLRDLGGRHGGYGVAAEHYPIFRQAFLDTLRVILGDKHTPEVEKAWTATIDTIIEMMLSAAHEGPKESWHESASVPAQWIN